MQPDRTRTPVTSKVPQIAVVEQERAWQYIGYATLGCQLQIYFCGIVLGVACPSPAFTSRSPILKVFLATIVIMNVVFTSFATDLVTALASGQHRDMFFILSHTRFSSIPSQLLYILIVTSSQILFAIRIIRVLERQLAKVIWLTTFVILVLVSSTSVVQAEVETFIGQHTESHNPGYHLYEPYGIPVALVAAAVTDILISVTLAVRLRHDILGFNTHTDSMLRRIIRTTLATGALTAVTASIGAATMLMYDTGLLSNWVMDIFIFPLPSLYCLSVFWTLNLRSRLRQERQGRAIEFSLAAPVSDESHAGACGQRTSPKVSLPDDVLNAARFGSVFGQLSQLQSGESSCSASSVDSSVLQAMWHRSEL